MKKTFLDKLKEKGCLVHHCKESKAILIYDKVNKETLVLESEEATNVDVLSSNDLFAFLDLKYADVFKDVADALHDIIEDGRGNYGIRYTKQ